MPFTVAHAAAALPFRRLKLVWSAFVIGSMAPDFPYVIGSVKYRALGHYFPGVVLFTLPISFVVLWFFHFAIKKPVAGLLPIGVQQRLSGQLERLQVRRRHANVGHNFLHHSRDCNPSGVGFLYSHLHVALAPFTVPAGRGSISRLRDWLQRTWSCNMPARCLGCLPWEYGSSLWYRTTEPDRGMALQSPVRSRVSLAVIMFAIAVGMGLMRAWLLIGEMPRTVHNWDWFMLNFGVTAIATAFWELLAYCLLATSRQYAGSRLRSV